MIEEQVPSFLFGTPSTPPFEEDPSSYCPVCERNDALTRVASIARSGRGRLLLEDGSSAEFESELSALLGEPEKPRPLPLWGIAWGCVFSFAALAVDLAIIALLRAQNLIAVPDAALDVAKWGGIGWFALLVPLVAVGRYLGSRDRAQKGLEPWRDAVHRWRMAYYCSRDDVVFLPHGEPVAPEEATSLWTPVEPPPPRRGPAPATPTVLPPEPSQAGGAE